MDSVRMNICAARVQNFLARHGMLSLVLTLLLGAVFFFDIGGRSISSPDEGRYIEIPREMVETGDYVLPRLNGILYFEKPPLFYWMEAVVIKTLGISEFTMRIWPALLGIAGCLMAYGVARRFYGKTAGVVAAIVLATSLLYYLLSRFIVIDMAVSTFMCASLFAFLLSAEEKDEKQALWWARGGHAAAACAVLCKGLIGCLLPGLVGLVWIVLMGRWSFVRRALCPTGILIFLIIAVPWHALAAMRNADFLWFYFVHEHWLRFTTTVHNRYQPAWYFLPIILVGFMPWTGYLWRAVKDALPASWRLRTTRPVELYLILWFVLILGFFSLSDSKLPTYVLPIFPPLAVLVGRIFAPRLETARIDDLPLGRWVAAGFFTLFALAVPIIYGIPSMRQDDNIGMYLTPVAPIVTAIAILFVIGVIAIFVLPRKYGERATVVTIAVTAIIGWTLISRIFSVADPNSVKPIAEVIQKYRHHNEEVVSYGTFFYDLPVYLRQKILIQDWTSEFQFGRTQEDTSKILIDEAAFRKKWEGHDLVFLAMRTRHFANWEAQGLPRGMCVLVRTERAVALANRPLSDEKGNLACNPWYDFDDPKDFHPIDHDPQLQHELKNPLAP